MTIRLNVIAAACENMGIGYKNDLPWRLKKEMAYFTHMTSKVNNPESGKRNAVVFARRTWDSVPLKYRPLPGRLNFVLSSVTDKKALGIDDGETQLYSTWDDLIKGLEQAKQEGKIEDVWIVGGSSIYKTAMNSPLCHRIYLTRILKDFECDTFFPEVDTSIYQKITDPEVSQELQEENGIQYKFEVYERK